MSFLRMQPGIFMLLLITGLLPVVHAAAVWIKQLIRAEDTAAHCFIAPF